MLTAFTILIILQFLVVVAHDLVEIPGWTNTRQMQAVVGKRKLYAATTVNGIFPGLAVHFAILYWHRTRPAFVGTYWMIYCAVTVFSAIGMWYLPYFMGVKPELQQKYEQAYAQTRQMLPARGHHSRPNLLHLAFHVLFVATLSLSLLLHFRSA